MKNKLLVILSLFIIVFMCIVPNCFAKDFTYNDTVYSVPDDILDSEYYCIFEDSYSNIYLFICYDGVAYVNPSKDNSFMLRNYKQYILNTDNSEWTLSKDQTGSTGLGNPTNIKNLIYTSVNIYNAYYVSGQGYILTNDIVYEGVPAFVSPSFITTQEELESGTFDYLNINMGSFSEYDTFYLHVARVDKPIKEDSNIIYYKDEKVFALDKDSSYFINTVESSFIYYSIPKEKFGFSIKNDNEYVFVLSSSSSSIGSLSSSDIYEKVDFTVAGLTFEEDVENSQDITNDKLDEANKTNKSILDNILKIVNFFNPLSKDFFMYQVVEFLIDMFKGLFVPEDNFFVDWVNDLNDYFGDRFGIIYYPFELLIDVLTRIAGISGSYDTAIISFGDLKLFDTVLIPAFSFDFFSLLTNDTLKSIHDIYLVVVDVILYLGLVLLAKNIFSEVFGGHFVDEVVNDAFADERSYSNYERYQSNKQRYKSENGGGN